MRAVTQVGEGSPAGAAVLRKAMHAKLTPFPRCTQGTSCRRAVSKFDGLVVRGGRGAATAICYYADRRNVNERLIGTHRRASPMLPEHAHPAPVTVNREDQLLPDAMHDARLQRRLVLVLPQRER